MLNLVEDVPVESPVMEKQHHRNRVICSRGIWSDNVESSDDIGSGGNLNISIHVGRSVDE
jgi:hypothetical protein